MTAIAARWSFFLLLLPGDATVISEASSGNVWTPSWDLSYIIQFTFDVPFTSIYIGDIVLSWSDFMLSPCLKNHMNTIGPATFRSSHCRWSQLVRRGGHWRIGLGEIPRWKCRCCSVPRRVWLNSPFQLAPGSWQDREADGKIDWKAVSMDSFLLESYEFDQETFMEFMAVFWTSASWSLSPELIR